MTKAELQEQLAHLVQQCTALEQMNEAQKAKVQNTKKRKMILQNMVSSLQDTKNELLNRVQQVQKEETERNFQINQQNRLEEDKISMQISKTKEIFLRIQKRCNLIESRKQYLTEKFNTINNQLDVQIADYNIKIDQMRSKTREIKVRSEELEKLFHLSRRRSRGLQEMSRSLHPVKTTIESVEHEIENSKKEIEEKEKELETLKVECQRLQKIRDALRKQKQEQQAKEPSA